MKKILVALSAAILLSLNVGCKTPTLEPGGVYTQVDTNGTVVYSDLGLALIDASWKLSYETVISVMNFERENRAILWEISPSIKQSLDSIRPMVVDIRFRWYSARKIYEANPTPAGLTTMQAILSEIERLIPVVQAQIEPARSTLGINP